MTKLFFLFPILFFLSNSFATDELPRPLPDDSYPSDPYPTPTPTPDPSPTPSPTPAPPAPETPYSIGMGETARFGTQTYNFFPRKKLNRVVHISVVGIRNKNEIKKIRIYYTDKSGPRDVYQLNGKISPGDVREANLDGRPISKVEIVASASYFWRSSGSFRVDVRAISDKAPRFDEDEGIEMEPEAIDIEN